MITQTMRPGPRSKRGVGREGSRELGAMIKDHRMKLGMSQEEFAQEMGWSSRGTVSPIESGSRALTAEDKVRRLSEVTGIPMDDIYTIQGYIPHDIYDDIVNFDAARMERLRQFIRAEL